MERSHRDLLNVLNLRPKEHVAVVGGGGKSTLCLALAKALRQNGARVISSTTTKVRQKEAEAYPCLLLCPSGTPDLKKLGKGLDEVGNVFLGHAFLENGKVDGISATLADTLFSMPDVGCLIIEADGAAGRPLKAPAAHEPVIPQSATVVIAVMGLTALGKPLRSDLVFRLAEFKALTGLQEGEILEPRVLSKAFDEKAGLFKNTPLSARRMVFLNQMDTLADRQAVLDLAGRLMSTQSAIERVISGSFRNNEFMKVP